MASFATTAASAFSCIESVVLDAETKTLIETLTKDCVSKFKIEKDKVSNLKINVPEGLSDIKKIMVSYFVVKEFLKVHDDLSPALQNTLLSLAKTYEILQKRTEETEVPEKFEEKHFESYATLPDSWIVKFKRSLGVDPEMKMQVIPYTSDGERRFYIHARAAEESGLGWFDTQADTFSVSFDTNGTVVIEENIPDSIRYILLNLRPIMEDIQRFALNFNSILEGKSIVMKTSEMKKVCDDGELRAFDEFLLRMKSFGISTERLERVFGQLAPIIKLLVNGRKTTTTQ